jgi:hypothetical protein
LEDAMTANVDWILEDVMRIGIDFVNHPALVLTPAEAAIRFGLEADACAAILGALLNSGVLAKTQEGAYLTFFPRCPPPDIGFECQTLITAALPA